MKEEPSGCLRTRPTYLLITFLELVYNTFKVQYLIIIYNIQGIKAMKKTYTYLKDEEPLLIMCIPSEMTKDYYHMNFDLKMELRS